MPCCLTNFQKIYRNYMIKGMTDFCFLHQTWIYLLFFSLLRLTNAINSSMTPPHSHMIPNAIFSAQNQNGDITIHVIAKIKIPLLLMIFLLKLRLLLTLYFVHLSKDSGMLWWKWERSLTCQTIYLNIFFAQ